MAEGRAVVVIVVAVVVVVVVVVVVTGSSINILLMNKQCPLTEDRQILERWWNFISTIYINLQVIISDRLVMSINMENTCPNKWHLLASNCHVCKCSNQLIHFLSRWYWQYVPPDRNRELEVPRKYKNFNIK